MFNKVERITPRLDVHSIPGGKWELDADLAYLIGGKESRAKKGTITDFSSVPGLARFIVAPPRTDHAGAIHDDAYKTGKVSRREADRAWRLIAQHGDSGANFVQAWLLWAGLRLGGWWQWNKYRKLDKK